MSEIIDTVTAYLCPICEEPHTTHGGAQACLMRCREERERHAEASRRWTECYARVKQDMIVLARKCKGAQLLMVHGFENDARRLLQEYGKYSLANLGSSHSARAICDAAMEECRRCAKGDGNEQRTTDHI